MKFTITREQLQEGLTAVAAAVPAKTTLPVLANVLVEATKQGLRLSGTDLDIAVSTTVAADVDAEGAVTLPAKKLSDIVRELPPAPIRMSAAGELRPDRMRMVATNGHRLAKMDVPASGGSTADLIVPPKALEQIRRLYAPEAELEVAKSDNHIGFRAGSTLVFSRLIEGPYPNYEQVIPRENDKLATIDKAAMTAALRRMSIVASDQTHRIRLAFTGGTVRFSVQTPDLGEAQDELPVTYEGEPLEIGFNAMYLLEILKYMPTDEVRLSFKAPERAATVEPVGWNDPASYMALVMPLRLVD